MNAALRVLVVVGSFEPGFRGGGAVRSVAQLVDTVPEEVLVSLVTRDRDLGSPEAYPGLSGRWVPRGRASVFYLNLRKPAQLWRLLLDLRRERFDVVYVNSLWSPAFTIVPVLAVRFRLLRAHRTVIAPRGELSPGALSIKSRKKSLFLFVWRPLLSRADVSWHASTPREATDISAVFPAPDIEVSLNQVGLPDEPLDAECPSGPEARFAFIGRISPKKNLLLVLEALTRVTLPVSLDIYGPPEDRDYWSLCQRAIVSMPPHIAVNYCGPVEPHEVPATFARYDAFVFPTLGENFGHVIAESLAASCPVICSAETPWTETLRAGGGSVIDALDATTLGAELQSFAGLSAAERETRRRSAGSAYREWRGTVTNDNVFARAGARWAARSAPR